MTKKCILRSAVVASMCVLFLSENVSAGSPSLNSNFGIKTQYISNLFNLDQEGQDSFDLNKGDGEQYAGMQEVSDVRIGILAETSLEWKVEKKRYITLEAQITRYGHSGNTIANYWIYEFGVKYDIALQNSVKFLFEYVPNRFKKNYKYYGGATKTYLASHYDQVELSGEYKLKFGQGYKAGLNYTYANRSYDKPFNGRDQKIHEFTLLGEKELSKIIDLSAAAGYASAKTPGDWNTPNYLAGFSRDRSYGEFFFLTGLEIGLPYSLKGYLESEFSFKKYTTNVETDELYYKRKVNKTKLLISLIKKFKNGLDVVFDARFVINNSNNNDVLYNELEEGDYNKNIFSLGVNYSL